MPIIVLPGGPIPRKRRLTRPRLALLVIAGLALCVIVTLGALASSSWAVNRLARRAEEEWGRAIHIERVNPIWLRGFEAVGVRVDPIVKSAPPLLEAQSVEIRISPLALLWGRIDVSMLRVRGLNISMFRDSKGRLSVGDLLAASGKNGEDEPRAGKSGAKSGANISGEKTSEGVKDTKPRRIRLHRVALEKSRVEFKDAWLSKEIPLVLSLEDFDFEIRDVESESPTPAHASFRARYRGVGINAREQVEPFDLALDFRHTGVYDSSREQYRVERLDLGLEQQGQAVGAGSLANPFSLTWDRQAPEAQLNPAEFSLKIDRMALAPFGPQVLPRDVDRITSGTISGDLSASIGGGGRLLDLAGSLKVHELGMTQFEGLDGWGSFAVKINASAGTLDRYEAELRLIRGDRVQGKVRVRGEEDSLTGSREGSLSVEDFDLTSLGRNVAGLSRDMAVLAGSASADFSWHGEPGGDGLATRGALDVRGVVFEGREEMQKSAPFSGRFESDLSIAKGRWVGGGPLARAFRIETFQGEAPLDDLVVAVDLRKDAPAEQNRIVVRGRTLALDHYAAMREIAREGQKRARKQRKGRRDEIEDLMKALHTDLATSVSLPAGELASPPRIPGSATGEPDEKEPDPERWPFGFKAVFDSATLGGRQWTDMMIQGAYTGTRLEVTTATARLENGVAQGRGRLSLETSPRAFEWQARFDRFPLGAIASMLPSKWNVTGTGLLDLSTEGTGRGGDPGEGGEGISARAQFSAVNGEIGGLGPMAALAEALQTPALRRLSFENLSGEARLNGGRFALGPVEAKSPAGGLRVWGDAGLNGALSLEFEVDQGAAGVRRLRVDGDWGKGRATMAPASLPASGPAAAASGPAGG